MNFSVISSSSFYLAFPPGMTSNEFPNFGNADRCASFKNHLT